MTAQEWYEQGNAYRKESKWHEAINCYIQAIALDPDSPAVEAKRMLDDIMARLSGCSTTSWPSTVRICTILELIF